MFAWFKKLLFRAPKPGPLSRPPEPAGSRTDRARPGVLSRPPRSSPNALDEHARARRSGARATAGSRDSAEGDFGTGVLLGAATGDPVLGGLLGRSMSGGIVGASLRDTPDTDCSSALSGHSWHSSHDSGSSGWDSGSCSGSSGGDSGGGGGD